MTPADLARQNAIAIEMKKDGLQQRQNGDWTVRFTVQAADMDPRLVQAAMGQRFMAALVAIGDDEMPKEQPAPVKPQASAEPPEERERRSWSELSPTNQAGIRCADPAFQTFLRETKDQRCAGTDDAAMIVRKLCGVNSRAALATNSNAGEKWHSLQVEYEAWRLSGR
jgi:hypothetical protein